MTGKIKRMQPAQTANGWKDEEPDLTSDEHDLMVAMIGRAWMDVEIDMSKVPQNHHDEMLAAKVTAFEWFTSEETYLMSFRSVCLHVGIENIEACRRVVLRGYVSPGEEVSEYMRSEYASVRREDRVYTKHVRSQDARRTPDPGVIDAECVETVNASPVSVLEPRPMPLLPPAPEPYTLEALVQAISLEEPTKQASGGNDSSNWLRAGCEGDEEAD